LGTADGRRGPETLQLQHQLQQQLQQRVTRMRRIETETARIRQQQMLVNGNFNGNSLNRRGRRELQTAGAFEKSISLLAVLGALCGSSFFSWRVLA
jgi:hypothetical protein